MEHIFFLKIGETYRHLKFDEHLMKIDEDWSTLKLMKIYENCRSSKLMKNADTKK